MTEKSDEGHGIISNVSETKGFNLVAAAENTLSLSSYRHRNAASQRQKLDAQYVIEEYFLSSTWPLEVSI